MDAWHQFVRRLGRSADHGDAVREASSLESIVALPTIGMDRRTRLTVSRAKAISIAADASSMRLMRMCPMARPRFSAAITTSC